MGCAIGRVYPIEGEDEPRGAPLYGLVGRLAICRGVRSLGRLRLRAGTADRGAHVYATGHVAHYLNGGGSLAYQSARVINRHWFHLELSHRDTGGDERIAEVAGDVFVM